MRPILAQRVLAAVMGWEQEQLLREQDLLQTLATYKYDMYQNFEPGVRFVESLAQWLHQFSDAEDRATAYRLVRDHLIFVSGQELLHLVRSVYPDVIRPVIRQAVATANGIPSFKVHQIEGSAAYKRLHRRSLFLGLSDGAMIDTFRRSSPELHNDQVYAMYDVGPERLSDMHKELEKDLAGALGTATTFSHLFLLDDFAGTGTTMLRRNADKNWSGRITKVAKWLKDAKSTNVVDPDLEVHICLYMTTGRALDYLQTTLSEFEAEGAPWRRSQVLHVQLIPETLAILPGSDPTIDKFLQKYYSKDLEDRESYRVGKKGIMYGYGGCGLPLVIHHNTPNNSLYVFWKDGVQTWPLTPLFRRFERHRDLLEPKSDGSSK